MLKDLFIEMKSLYQKVREERENVIPQSLLKELSEVKKTFFQDETLTDEKKADLMIISKVIEDILNKKQKIDYVAE